MLYIALFLYGLLVWSTLDNFLLSWTDKALLLIPTLILAVFWPWGYVGWLVLTNVSDHVIDRAEKVCEQ